jgi:hypothetical protein
MDDDLAARTARPSADRLSRDRALGGSAARDGQGYAQEMSDVQSAVPTDSSPTQFRARRVDVQHLAPSPEAVAVKSAYEGIFGAEPENRGGWYHPADWGRTTYVLSRLRSGDAALDVGAGAGQFMNMMATSGKFGSVTALDHTRFNKYTELFDNIHRVDGSIADMEFEDDSFAVVTCMEVLEHIPTEIFDAGLRELRRVCSGQLVMTVPFEEPEPLSKGHVRRFVERDVMDLFPNGRYTILDRPKKPWILIEEHLDGSPFEDAPELTAADLRILELERQLAVLRARRSLRAANWTGAKLRSLRRRLPSSLRA